MSLEHPTESDEQLGDQFINPDAGPDESEVTPVKTSGVAPWFKPVALLAVLATVAIYALRLDRVVGLVVDDAWYVLLAKALAEGQGYALINSPSPGILPLYPPGFPFVLSLFYRMYPQFPENVWLLKSVSIAAMMMVGALCYRYFTRVRAVPEAVGLGIAVLTMICPPLVFLATSSVMSDCVFTLWFLSVIVATEACQRARNSAGAWRWAILSAVFSSAAFLTRSIAISLIVAVVLYLLKERLIRSAAIFSVAVLLLCGPWMLYSRLHAPTPSQQLEQGGNMILPYTVQFWQKVAGDSTSATTTAADLPKRVWVNTSEFLGRDVCRILMAVVFEALRDPFKDAERFLKEKSESHGELLLFSFLLSFWMIVGYIALVRERLTFAEIAVPLSLGIIVLWPFETVRYVLPLAPFVIFYFLMGLRSTHQFLSKRLKTAWHSWRLVQIALTVLLVINFYANVRYILNYQWGSPLDQPEWISKFEDAEKLFEQIRQQVPKINAIASVNPAMVTLYTGHKTVAWDNPDKRWEVWKSLSVRYLVWLSLYPQTPEAAEASYRRLYSSRRGTGFRLLDLGPPESRIPWGAKPNANGN